MNRSPPACRVHNPHGLWMPLNVFAHLTWPFEVIHANHVFVRQMIKVPHENGQTRLLMASDMRIIINVLKFENKIYYLTDRIDILQRSTLFKFSYFYLLVFMKNEKIRTQVNHFLMTWYDEFLNKNAWYWIKSWNDW